MLFSIVGEGNLSHSTRSGEVIGPILFEILDLGIGICLRFVIWNLEFSFHTQTTTILQTRADRFESVRFDFAQ